MTHKLYATEITIWTTAPIPTGIAFQATMQRGFRGELFAAVEHRGEQVFSFTTDDSKASEGDAVSVVLYPPLRVPGWQGYAVGEWSKA